MKKNYKKNILKQSIIGFIAGIISGLFSTGGGMILVPAFIYLLNINATKARGTSVFCILPMVVTSGIFYYKENFIEWKTAILCAIGGAIGGYIRSEIIKKIARKNTKSSIYNIFNICII